jgi:GNAT superfamily N-acetyltransferase
MIQDFKKAEALQYDKIGSDLEGPFARVGQPGFKNTFEQRREAVENRRTGGPRSMQDIRSEAEEVAAIEFDEKEARIKEQQDIETNALRTQQSQAEQFRQVMADALFSGQLEGTGLEGSVKNMIDTLTGELATSEQAEMGPGGELTFKGVPALEEAVRMARQAKDIAQQKAREVLGKDYQQYITNPITSRQDTQTALMTQVVANTAGLIGALNQSVSQQAASLQQMSAAVTSAGGVPAVETAAPTMAAAMGMASATVPAASRAGIAPAAPSQVGMGGAAAGGLTALGSHALSGAAKTTSFQTSKVSNALADFTNVIQQEGENLVRASTYVGDKLVGSQEFEIKEEAGRKFLKAQHIQGEGSALPQELQGKGIGSKRMGQMVDWARERGFSSIESTFATTPGQTRTYQKAAQATGAAFEVMPGAEEIGEGSGRFAIDDTTKSAMRINIPSDEAAAAAARRAKLGKYAMRGAGGLAAVGSAVGGAQMGGVLHRAGLAQTPEEKAAVAGDLGEQAGFWGLTTGGAMGGAALGSAFGPVGTAVGGVAGGLAGAGAGMLTSEPMRYAGQYWDQKTGGALSGAAGAVGNFISQPGAALGDKYGQTGVGKWLADLNVPTWLGGPGAPAVASAGQAAGVMAAPSPPVALPGAPAVPAAGMGLAVPGAAPMPPARPDPWAWLTALESNAMTQGGTSFLPKGGLQTGPVPTYDLGKRVEGAANVYKGTARTYTGGDEDQFVQAQTIRPKTGGPLTEAENLRTLGAIEQKSPATRIFTPEAFDSMPFGDTSQMSPQQMLERIQKTRAMFEARESTMLPAQGPTNTNIESERRARSQFGNPEATTEGVTTDRTTPGSREDTRRRADEGETAVDRGAGPAQDTEALASAIASLNEQFSSLVSALEGITGLGDKIDGTTAAVEALGEGLEVNVTGGTIEVSNLGEVGDAINTGVSAIGADVTDARTRLALLETVVDPNGTPVDERLTEFQTTLDTAVQQVATDIETAKEELRTEVTDLATATASESTRELETKLTTLEGLQSDLQAAKEEQDRLLETINAAIEKAQAELAAAAEAATSATETAANARDEIAGLGDRTAAAEEQAASAESRVDALETSAQAATETANEALNTANAAKTAVGQETTNRQTADQELSTRADRIEEKNSQQDDEIKKINKDLGPAVSNARLALNNSQKR